jgi:glycosyltransferase involved in cell wall biosynthesis
VVLDGKTVFAGTTNGLARFANGRWTSVKSTAGASVEALAAGKDKVFLVLNGRLLWVAQPDVTIFFRAADAFVMNSQESGENFGRVTIEAMAFSLPILGTSEGGTKEIVLDEKTGLLHPVGEAGLEILGANILRLANDRKYARQLGAAGQQRASKYFSSQRFFRELENALAPACR